MTTWNWERVAFAVAICLLILSAAFLVTGCIGSRAPQRKDGNSETD